jgi:hypothetical protein
MKKALQLIGLSMLVTLPAMAQINDNFSDGNFTANPVWSGDNSKFTVAANELWLNAPVVTDVAFLSTQSTVMSKEFQCNQYQWLLC